MKGLFISLLSLINLVCAGQSEEKFVLLDAQNDREQLARVIKLLKGLRPKLICVNVDLFRCDDEKPLDTILNHEDDSNSILTIYPSEAEKQLRQELITTKSLLMPSTIRSFSDMEITGCNFLYSQEMPIGHIDLIEGENDSNQVDKFLVSFAEEYGHLSWHYATRIAFALDSTKTDEFVKNNKGVVEIDFHNKRVFSSISYEDIMNGGVKKKDIEDKVVIIGMQSSHFQVRMNGNDHLIQMSTSEIFANIACQIIDN